MSEKNTLRTRLVNKHDIEANWLKATNFTPLQGELIVYDVDENYNYERIKMGDGITNVNELPFISPQADWNQNDETQSDFIKNKPEGLASEEYVNASIEKTGFIEKNNHSELVIADNVNLKVDLNGGRTETYVDWPSGIPLQEGTKVLVRITPEGQLTGSPGVFTANEPAEIVATVGRGGIADSWLLNLEQPYNLVIKEGSDSPFRTIKSILYSSWDGENYFLVSPDDYEIGGARRLQGTMTYSLSIVFGASGAAFENITLWSNTEGSTKQFELCVDDDANATLTDIATGETKLLGGVQSDWNETDETSLAFIKNKPIIPTDADAWETLIAIGMYERIADETGAVLTDETGNVLLLEGGR